MRTGPWRNASLIAVAAFAVELAAPLPAIAQTRTSTTLDFEVEEITVHWVASCTAIVAQLAGAR